MRELRMEDTTSFFNYLRMQPAMFDEILNRVGPRIQKKDTNLRKCLDPGLKLAITIRHLASGDKYPTLQYDRVARKTICSIIPEVWRAIVLEYKDELIPSSKQSRRMGSNCRIIPKKVELASCMWGS